MDDLVKRLRHKKKYQSSDDTCAAYFKRWERLDNPDGPEAADHIEQLEAAIREAIRIGSQPHYGDDVTALDHYAEAMYVLREALNGQ